MELMGVDPFGSSWWGPSWSATRGLVGKPVVRRPRLRSDSYDKYMSWTELLMYTMERQDDSAPFVDLLVSLANNAPSIEFGEQLAVEKLIWIGAGGRGRSHRPGNQTRPIGLVVRLCPQSQIHQQGEGWRDASFCSLFV